MRVHAVQAGQVIAGGVFDRRGGVLADVQAQDAALAAKARTLDVGQKGVEPVVVEAEPVDQRTRLLQAEDARLRTPATLTDLAAVAALARAQGALSVCDNTEEFLPGLVCVAVPVPTADPAGRSTACVALQAPAVRLPIERALQWLPALQKAARALSRIESDATAEPEPVAGSSTTTPSTQTAPRKRR